MGPIEAVKTGYRQSFTYAGRATRSEFWWLAAFCLVIVSNLLTYGLGSVAPLEAVAIFQIALAAVPLTACLARRMRDTGRHALWALPAFIVMVSGPIMVLLGIGESFALSMESDEETMPDTGHIVVLSVLSISALASLPTVIFCFLKSARPTSTQTDDNEMNT